MVTRRFAALRLIFKPVKVAGGSPAASYFSCSAKKSNQKKAAPAHRPCGLPCAARQAGRLRNSPSQKTRGLRQSSPTTPGLTALLGGSQGGPRWYAVIRSPSLSEAGRKPMVLKFIPGAPPSSGVAPGDVGEHCASARNGLEERFKPARSWVQSSNWCASCAAARWDEQRRGVRRTGKLGCPFLWLLSFGQAKESD